LAYEQRELVSQAIDQLRKAVKVSKGNPTMVASLGRTYALAGKRDQVRRVLRQLKDLSGRLYVSPYELALIHAGLEDKDQAFTHLQEAYEHRSGGLNKSTPMGDRRQLRTACSPCERERLGPKVNGEKPAASPRGPSHAW